MEELNLDDQSEIIQAFAQESQSLIMQLEPSIAALKKSGSQQTVSVIYRFFHTIKGGASFLGLNNIAQVTNEVESLLDQIRSSSRPFDAHKDPDL